MTIKHCGTSIVSDWLCTNCGYEWSTTDYTDHMRYVCEPDNCPNCKEES